MHTKKLSVYINNLIQVTKRNIIVELIQKQLIGFHLNTNKHIKTQTLHAERQMGNDDEL